MSIEAETNKSLNLNKILYREKKVRKITFHSKGNDSFIID